jgi:hypothetical protein
MKRQDLRSESAAHLRAEEAQPAGSRMGAALDVPERADREDARRRIRALGVVRAPEQAEAPVAQAARARAEQADASLRMSAALVALQAAGASVVLVMNEADVQVKLDRPDATPKSAVQSVQQRRQVSDVSRKNAVAAALAAVRDRAQANQVVASPNNAEAAHSAVVPPDRKAAAVPADSEVRKDHPAVIAEAAAAPRAEDNDFTSHITLYRGDVGFSYFRAT